MPGGATTDTTSGNFYAVVDSSGKWTTYPGTIDAMGNFDIPGVPQGPYWLETVYPPQDPIADEQRMQLLCVQRLHGGLTIGDTHSYDEPFAFDVDEEPYDHLRARAEALGGWRAYVATLQPQSTS